MENIINKFTITTLVAVTMYMTLTLNSCKSSESISNQKNKKKKVDTLFVFQPYVIVNSIVNKKHFLDDELSIILKNKIDKKTNSLLSGRYKLTNVSDRTDTIPQASLSDLFLRLDNPKNQSLKIEIPTFIQKAPRNKQVRYSLMIFFQAYYNNDYQPNHFVNTGFQTNTVYISFKHMFGADIRLIVFDYLENKIVFYKKRISHSSDPRIVEQIEQMVSDILRPVYYNRQNKVFNGKYLLENR